MIVILLPLVQIILVSHSSTVCGLKGQCEELANFIHKMSPETNVECKIGRQGMQACIRFLFYTKFKLLLVVSAVCFMNAVARLGLCVDDLAALFDPIQTIELITLNCFGSFYISNTC